MPLCKSHLDSLRQLLGFHLVAISTSSFVYIFWYPGIDQLEKVHWSKQYFHILYNKLLHIWQQLHWVYVSTTSSRRESVPKYQSRHHLQMSKLSRRFEFVRTDWTMKSSDNGEVNIEKWEKDIDWWDLLSDVLFVVLKSFLLLSRPTSYRFFRHTSWW